MTNTPRQRRAGLDVTPVASSSEERPGPPAPSTDAWAYTTNLWLCFAIALLGVLAAMAVG